MRRVFAAYGEHVSQRGELFLPPGGKLARVICLLHGGFWRAPYGPEQLAAVATNLCTRGYAVWNLGYRRLGEPGGGWQGTFDDVTAGIDYLVHLAEQGHSLDLTQVVVAGHSSGGHLALWVAKHGTSRVNVCLAVGLAPITNLRLAQRQGLGNDAVAALLAAPPGETPPAYALTSPIERLPLGVQQLIIHGAGDQLVPSAMSKAYVNEAKRCGDQVMYCEIPMTGHMEFLDDTSELHAVLCKQLELFFKPKP